MYCNARNWPAPWLDLRLNGWSRAGYEAAFRGVYRELREDRLPYPPEVHMRAVLDRVMGRVRVVRRFTMQPRIEGVRGTEGCAARRPLTPWLRV